MQREDCPSQACFVQKFIEIEGERDQQLKALEQQPVKATLFRTTFFAVNLKILSNAYLKEFTAESSEECRGYLFDELAPRYKWGKAKEESCIDVCDSCGTKGRVAAAAAPATPAFGATEIADIDARTLFRFPFCVLRFSSSSKVAATLFELKPVELSSMRCSRFLKLSGVVHK